MVAEGDVELYPIDDLSLIELSAIPLRFQRSCGSCTSRPEAVVARHPSVPAIIDGLGFTWGIARRGAGAADLTPSRSWNTSRPRSGPGGRDAPGDRGPTSTTSWRCCRSSPRFHRRLRRAALHLCRPSAGRKRSGGTLGPKRPRRRAAALADPPVLLVLPGSRPGELEAIAGRFRRRRSALLSERVGSLELIVATFPHLAVPIREASAATAAAGCGSWSRRRTSRRCSVSPRAALAKSGTVTLELAASRRALMIAVYKVSAIEYMRWDEESR